MSHQLDDNCCGPKLGGQGRQMAQIPETHQPLAYNPPTHDPQNLLCLSISVPPINLHVLTCVTALELQPPCVTKGAAKPLTSMLSSC